VSYRLTKMQLDAIKLVETSWDEVKSKGINTIYIRSHENADFYGPYLVVDADQQMISRQDGEGGWRRYPRNKGLYRRILNSELAGDRYRCSCEPKYGPVLNNLKKEGLEDTLNLLNALSHKKRREGKSNLRVEESVRKAELKPDDVFSSIDKISTQIDKDVKAAEEHLEKLYQRQELIRDILGELTKK